MIKCLEKKLDITGFFVKNIFFIFSKCHKFDLNFINVIGESLKMLSSLNNSDKYYVFSICLVIDYICLFAVFLLF